MLKGLVALKHLHEICMPIAITQGTIKHSFLLHHADVTGQQHDINGGNPMFLDGPLVLCARSSNATNTSRTLNGRLTQFSIFDQALNATQVQILYQQVSHTFGTNACFCLCQAQDGRNSKKSVRLSCNPGQGAG